MRDDGPMGNEEDEQGGSDGLSSQLRNFTRQSSQQFADLEALLLALKAQATVDIEFDAGRIWKAVEKSLWPSEGEQGDQDLGDSVPGK